MGRRSTGSTAPAEAGKLETDTGTRAAGAMAMACWVGCVDAVAERLA